MYVIRFSPVRVVEFATPQEFDARAKRWLTIREAENTYLLATLATLTKQVAGPRAANGDGRIAARLFVIEDAGAVVAAGTLSTAGDLAVTWATQEMIDVLADHAVQAGWTLRSVYGPEHVAWNVAYAYAKQSGKRVEAGKAERIYQLARARYQLPPGRLELATAADRALLRPWFHHFAQEVALEASTAEVDTSMDALLAERLLYLWKAPEAVSMAAWVAPTSQGATMSYVYTPPEHRGHGHGKAVVAALGAHMLGRGLKFCFIHTDVRDTRSNHVYQAIGANAVCEVLRCTLHPLAEGARAMAGARGNGSGRLG